MILVKVELHPYGDSTRAKEIGRFRIYNDMTGTPDRGNYKADVYRMPFNAELLRPRMTRHAEVKNYPRKSKHVLNLVARTLTALGYK